MQYSTVLVVVVLVLRTVVTEMPFRRIELHHFVSLQEVGLIIAFSCKDVREKDLFRQDFFFFLEGDTNKAFRSLL